MEYGMCFRKSYSFHTKCMRSCGRYVFYYQIYFNIKPFRFSNFIYLNQKYIKVFLFFIMTLLLTGKRMETLSWVLSDLTFPRKWKYEDANKNLKHKLVIIFTKKKNQIRVLEPSFHKMLIWMRNIKILKTHIFE